MDDAGLESPSPATEPIRARTLNEWRYRLMVTPCPRCGKGPWETGPVNGSRPPGQEQVVRARCGHCGGETEFRFTCEFASPVDGDPEVINPVDEPSRIIDLGQWLSLFYLMIESAASERSKPGTRRQGYRASLCLAEALKFYGDGELPPAPAFFAEHGAAIFREHPENFARQRLRDMQAKLPSLNVMQRRVERDEQTAGRRWWQFWRR
ncbi:MAG TPA: hypothetical protein VMZ50_04350 [Phycisphaerae bacterium]|nr:hypothetical protein [Phycisphaerae bacterium]